MTNEKPTVLIVFEGLDQSGKETQARRLAESLAAEGRRVETLSFPDYETPIGREIGAALAGEREFPPDVMQLLYIANRYEWRPKIEQWLREGAVVVCDRYAASSIAYGESHGLDAAWLDAAQQYLPRADLTFVLDIAPETASARKRTGRDKYERDLALLSRVRASYRRQATQLGWTVVDGEQPKDAIAAEIARVVAAHLA